MTKRKVTLQLPNEFVSICEYHKVKPETVLRGFIADLCELRTDEYSTNGSDERLMARAYYNRVGYPYVHSE